MPGPVAWVPLASFCLALLLMPLVRRYALYRGLIDRPEARRSHARPTPRGGGIAMGAALVPALAWALAPSGLPVYAPPLLLIFLLGLVDDHRAVPVRVRLACQSVAALWLVAGLGGVSGVDIAGFRLEAPWLWSPLAVVAVVWLVNLHNFMDGANGIAAGQGIFVGLVYGGLCTAGAEPGMAVVAFGLAAVCLAFLPWNLLGRGFFMGDSGSMLVGLVVALLAVTGAIGGVVSIWQSLLLSAVFVVDATTTLVIRLRAGQRWYTPHRHHAYQRLVAAGIPHAGVAILYAAVNILVVLPAVMVSVAAPRLDIVLAAMVCAILVAGYRLACRFTDIKVEQKQ